MQSNYIIREITSADYPQLEDFLYNAIFIPTGEEYPAREIIFQPEIYVYVKDFGLDTDCGVVAEQDGKLIGAAWTRIIPAYGHLDENTPELAISVLSEYRGGGVGTLLMKRLFELLREHGYKRTSLSVQQNNPAVRFYERLGYRVTDEKIDHAGHDDFIMVKDLLENTALFLAEDKYVDFTAPNIQSKAYELFNGIKDEIQKARIAYEFVRDKIPHSFDVGANVVTAKASDVLRSETGICHAKANLLTALLRSQKIPTGFCFQHITLMNDDSKGYCVHCYNAVRLDGRWIKIDARGNKAGVDARFSLDKPILAFPCRSEYDEYHWRGIYAAPHIETMQMLEQAKNLQDVIDNIPDMINQTPDIEE